MKGSNIEYDLVPGFIFIFIFGCICGVVIRFNGCRSLYYILLLLVMEVFDVVGDHVVWSLIVCQSLNDAEPGSSDKTL